MGNNISLEENNNEGQSQDIQNNDVEMKPVSYHESGENPNNDVQPTLVKKIKKNIPNDVLKKRRSTSKNSNNSISYKKTKSSRRR